MSIKDRYQIRPITYRMAMGMVVPNHYLHRKCPFSKGFGLFEGERMQGCIVYGTPSSSTLRKGIYGQEEAGNVIELNRLWIKDETPKNAESFLIGNTLKMLDKDIVVSFAEIKQGHIGLVYQATNWIYTGLSAKRTDWTVKGLDKHSQTIADQHTAQELREKYGDNFTLEERPRKHRYIYFATNKRRKKELLKKLKYEIKPYPKNGN